MIAFVFWCSTVVVTGEADEQENQSNIQLLREAARAAAGQAGQFHRGQTVFLTITPRDVAGLLESAIRKGFEEVGVQVVGRDSTTISMEVSLVDSRIEYRNPRRRSFLGERVVDRVVRLTLSMASHGGRPVDYSATVQDVIPQAHIEGVEHPAISITRGWTEPEDFPGGIIEPFIVTGAIGVAIYLLFSVRS